MFHEAIQKIKAARLLWTTVYRLLKWKEEILESSRASEGPWSGEN